MEDWSIEYQQNRKFWIVRASEGVEGDKGGGKKLFKEIIADNFPNLRRDLNIQICKVHKSPDKLNIKRSLTIYPIIKL